MQSVMMQGGVCECDCTTWKTGIPFPLAFLCLGLELLFKLSGFASVEASQTDQVCTEAGSRQPITVTSVHYLLLIAHPL